MKKLLAILANGRPSQENFYNLYDASLPDDRNYSFSETNVSKYYPFDSDGYDTTKLEPVQIQVVQLWGRRKKMTTSQRKKTNIGKNPQKTINVNEKQFIKEAAQDCEAHHWFKNYSSYFKVDFQNLLDCQERLAKKYISLISQHVDDQWKEFLKYLGLEKTALEILESRNENNRILYDSLHNYMTLFPNTSLGFVIFALGQVHQVFVIEKLAEELNNETEHL